MTWLQAIGLVSPRIGYYIDFPEHAASHDHHLVAATPATIALGGEGPERISG